VHGRAIDGVPGPDRSLSTYARAVPVRGTQQARAKGTSVVDQWMARAFGY